MQEQTSNKYIIYQQKIFHFNHYCIFVMIWFYTGTLTLLKKMLAYVYLWLDKKRKIKYGY